LFQTIFLISIQPQITQKRIKSHQRTICLVFLSFLKRFKVNEMRERELHNCFYTCSLNHRATSSLLGQPEPDFHYIQKFYKSHTKITLLNKENCKIFDLQKSRYTPCKNHTYRPEITSGKPTKGTRTSKPDGGCP